MSSLTSRLFILTSVNLLNFSSSYYPLPLSPYSHDYFPPIEISFLQSSARISFLALSEYVLSYFGSLGLWTNSRLFPQKRRTCSLFDIFIVEFFKRKTKWWRWEARQDRRGPTLQGALLFYIPTFSFFPICLSHFPSCL